MVFSDKLDEYGAGLRAREFSGALYSPHEVRVESRQAIPQLAAYLAERLWRNLPTPDDGAERGPAPS